jgi:NTP pyrophosphatase (non-canonical NTP hydrolase)
MTIKKMQDKAFANALKHGFHHKGQNIGEMLMLIVSELGEALESDRKGRRFDRKDTEWLSIYANRKTDDDADTFDMMFIEKVKDTFEDELADVVIRVADMCGYLGIDLESHIKAKMKYNESRPHKHGKEY